MFWNRWKVQGNEREAERLKDFLEECIEYEILPEAPITLGAFKRPGLVKGSREIRFQLFHPNFSSDRALSPPRGCQLTGNGVEGDFIGYGPEDLSGLVGGLKRLDKSGISLPYLKGLEEIPYIFKRRTSGLQISGGNFLLSNWIREKAQRPAENWNMSFNTKGGFPLETLSYVNISNAFQCEDAQRRIVWNGKYRFLGDYGNKDICMEDVTIRLPESPVTFASENELDELLEKRGLIRVHSTISHLAENRCQVEKLEAGPPHSTKSGAYNFDSSIPLVYANSIRLYPPQLAQDKNGLTEMEELALLLLEHQKEVERVPAVG